MNWRKILVIGFVVFAILLASASFYLYQIAKSPNFQIRKEAKMLYIPKGATFRTVLDSLKKYDMIHDITSFAFVSKLLKYQENVKEGAYLIKANATNLEVVRELRNGEQTALNITFNNIRIKKDLAQRISKQLLISETELLKTLQNPEFCKKYGFDTTTIMTMFLPNTYQMYWNTTLDVFLDKMHKEYEKFWTAERKAKAQKANLTEVQVSVLASIVEGETRKIDEKPRVAGVYMNRLKKNDLLQADPTVIFGIGDFTIKRVLNKHLAFDSPYNTYKYPGLPPGPINLPSVSSLESVLNYETHDYYFFCAKEDFSGYHNFAKNLSEHNANARKYQKALTEKGY
jgi:UPF0755 protein